MSVYMYVCVISMSFTPNIVNIHRTILHVLALHLGRGEILVYFTRTPQKREDGGREGLARGRGGGGGRRGGGGGVSNSFSRL